MGSHCSWMVEVGAPCCLGVLRVCSCCLWVIIPVLCCGGSLSFVGGCSKWAVVTCAHFVLLFMGVRDGHSSFFMCGHHLWVIGAVFCGFWNHMWLNHTNWQNLGTCVMGTGYAGVTNTQPTTTHDANLHRFINLWHSLCAATAENWKYAAQLWWSLFAVFSCSCTWDIM